MKLIQGAQFAGVSGTCAEQNPKFCKYHLNVVSLDSDGNIDAAPYFTAIKINGTDYLPTVPIIMNDVVALQNYLNSLNKGTFTVVSVGDNRVEIVTKYNSNIVEGIRYTVEGKNLELAFEECDCTELTPCDQNERCTYELYRKFETSREDKVRFKSIVFATGTYTPTTPIDTQDVKAVVEFVNSILESEEAFVGFYDANTLYLQAHKLKYTPQAVVFEIETVDLETGATVLTEHHTYFSKRNCFTGCCQPVCGKNGYPPCNNEAKGCNDGLVVNMQGLCAEPCQSGWTYFMDEKIPAGALGQLPDCAGKCAEGLVANAWGCYPANDKALVCDIDIIISRNKFEYFLGINLGVLGYFDATKNGGEFLLGDGTALEAWLNSPTTGICPDGVAQCATVTANVNSTGASQYTIHFTGIAFDLSNVVSLVSTTEKFKGICAPESYCTELVPVDCYQKEISYYCPAGQSYNANWARCVDLPTDECNSIEERKQKGLPYKCTTPVPKSADYENNKPGLIARKVQEMAGTPTERIWIQYFEALGITPDKNIIATHILIAEGVLHADEAYCVEGRGEIKI